MLLGFLVVCGIGTAVYVAIGFQAVLGCSHHVRGFHCGLHKYHNVVDLDTGHGAEGIDIGCTATNLHADSVVYLTLAERQDGGGTVQLLSPDHRLHVKDLAVHTLYQHREEVRVAEVQCTCHVH